MNQIFEQRFIIFKTNEVQGSNIVKSRRLLSNEMSAVKRNVWVKV